MPLPTARGQTHRGERRYPRGSKAPEEGVALSVEEISAKFRHNASGVISPEQANRLIEGMLELETCTDISALMANAMPN